MTVSFCNVPQNSGECPWLLVVMITLTVHHWVESITELAVWLSRRLTSKNSAVVLLYVEDHRYLFYCWRGESNSKSKQERYLYTYSKIRHFINLTVVLGRAWMYIISLPRFYTDIVFQVVDDMKVNPQNSTQIHSIRHNYYMTSV